jgi:superfamily II DNA/RNA helicase
MQTLTLPPLLPIRGTDARAPARRLRHVHAPEVWHRDGSTDNLTDTSTMPDATPDAVEAPAPDDAALPQAAGPADDAPDDEYESYPDEPEAAPQSGFAELGLSPEIVRAVAEKGYVNPTPIQAQAIPYVLMGRDLLGTAQTGTGKTAGFTLPMLDILQGSRARARMPRSLILEPTRELALQVAENFVEYGKYLKLTHALVIGGESMSDQKDILMRGVDVLIATPGRLMDMFERGSILLTDVKVLVIDEADRMLDMGFIPDVEKIVSLLPRNRQTLFFSATMAPEIKRLADAFLQNPKEVAVSRAASVATTITEGLTLVAEIDKREALRRLIRSEEVQNALIFCNRKRDVDILYKSLSKHGFSVGALHGDMAQPARFATLEKFKAGELRLLCCSDVAARGIDIGGLSHVFNFDVPHHSEDYVHRIGRTGRAGREGRAFTLASPEDRQNVEAIEKLIGHPIPRIEIDGLDAVEWAEGDGRRRGRGRSAAPKREAKPEPKARERGRDREKDRDRPAKAPREEIAEVPVAAAPEKVVAEAPAPAPRRERERDRDRPRRDDRPREDRPREERGRDERRFRRDDDLGPRVMGFGDDIPAFMLIAPRRRVATSPDAAEAAVETEN